MIVVVSGSITSLSALVSSMRVVSLNAWLRISNVEDDAPASIECSTKLSTLLNEHITKVLEGKN